MSNPGPSPLFLTCGSNSNLMNRIQFHFNVAGQTLNGQVYPASGVKAAVIIVHGMGEHSGRYERTVIPRLIQDSIGVVSYDQFGHGVNTGKKGHNPGYEYVLDCVDHAIEKAMLEFPEQPIFLYGHSMGGNVVVNYALKRPGRISGVVATSPFLRLAFEPPAWKVSLGKILGGIWPSMTMANEIDAAHLSRIEEEVRAYSQDPLVHDRVSPAYSIEFITKGEWALKHAGELRLPMLLLHGTSDRLTDWKASQEFAEKAGSIVEFLSIEGGYHELHHDLEKDRVLEKVVSWILGRSK